MRQIKQIYKTVFTFQNFRLYTYILLITLLPSFLLFLPFLFRLDQFLFLTIPESGMYNLVKNWDGPHYIIIAKTAYNELQIEPYLFISIPASYFAAHLPLFPFFIFLFAPLFGWLYSGLFANLLFGFLLNVLFYFIARKYTKYPLLLTFVFTVFPPRFIIVRSIIAPETLLVLLMLMSLYLWERKQYFFSGVAGFFAMLTKIQGALLFPAYMLYIGEEIWKKRRIRWGYVWSLLIPLAYILLSIYYHEKFGDYFAFLIAQKGVEMKFFFPFGQFNSENPWSRNAWLEDVVLYFWGMALLVFAMYKSKDRSWFYFSLVYTVFLMFIPQRDIARLAVPILPIFLLRFEKFFTSRLFIVSLCVILPAIYLYAINFLLESQAPVVNWEPFLR